MSEETLEIYAPWPAMGMQTLREELEQLAKWGKPEAYRTVVDKLAEIHKELASSRRSLPI